MRLIEGLVDVAEYLIRASRYRSRTSQPWSYSRRYPSQSYSAFEIGFSTSLRERQPISVTEITVADGIFTLKSIEDLPEHLHLFETVQEAEDWHGEEVAQGYTARHYVVREFSEDVDEETPECNEAWVTGLDTASMQPIKVFYRDRDSQNPNLSIRDKTEKDLGEEKLYGYYSSQLTSYVACVRALKTLVPRVTNVRRIARIACDLLRWPDGAPVWRGDILAIKDRGYYEVKSFGGSIDRTAEHRSVEEDDGDETNFASMTYVLERLYPWEPED